MENESSNETPKETFVSHLVELRNRFTNEVREIPVDTAAGQIRAALQS